MRNDLYLLMPYGTGAFLVSQTVKNPPAVWETWVRSLDWEDPLEESMATHSSILAWRIPWTDALGVILCAVHWGLPSVQGPWSPLAADA